MRQQRAISNRRIWTARAFAAAADLVQVAILPYFFEGALSPLNAALDVVVAVVLILLVGWHIAFVPAFIAEMLPFVDLAPTWTVAAFIATRGKRSSPPADKPQLPPT